MVIRISQEDAITAVNGTENLKIFAFSPLSAKTGALGGYDSTLGQYITYEAGWEPFTLAGDVGQWFRLTNDVSEIFNNLMEILEDTACATTSE
jgi:hypothetical protein